MTTRKIKSESEMLAFGEDFARSIHAPACIQLVGDVGAGKTTFTQGLAAALGVPGRVTSPTFCIVQEHRRQSTADDCNRLLVHMDLYRLHGEDDVIAIGWEDYLAEGAILVVEWPERAGALIPAEARHVVFTHLEGEESRRIEFR